MSQARMLSVLVVAWAVPIAWIAATLLAGPADGSRLAPRLSGVADDRWGDELRVDRTYGDTPLLPGDVVKSIEGRSPGDWVRSGDAPDRAVGDVVTYVVRRTQDPTVPLDLRISVPLTRYPLVAAVRANPVAVVLALVLLGAGSFAWWRRPGTLAATAFLAATSLAPSALTAYPFGLGAIDLAGGRGPWPQLAGELLAAVGAGCAVAAAVALTGEPGWWRGHRWAWVAPILAPLTGWGAWLLLVRDRLSAGGPAAWQAWGTVVVPALLVALPVLLLALGWVFSRARVREDLQAARLALVGTGGAALAWLALGQLPQWLAGTPLVPLSVLTPLVLPVAIACAAVAIGRYRLEEVEPAVRRGAVQLAVAALVGAAFVLVVRAVDVSADVSAESMLAGGMIALLLLPVAVALQRGARRLVYGDRELPSRVVSDLRTLDPTSAPEEALQEVLAVLARRLRLAHASVEVFATADADAVTTSTGTSTGTPVDVDLAVGGTTLGRLRLEVAPGRDPFGAGDRRLLEDVGSQVGALVQAIGVNRELQESRRRLVAAREEERRRLRRDLHDGLGPSLASLAMRLEAAQDLIAVDPARAAEVVGELSDRARGEIAEVRRLVDGLRPPALDQLGLVPALRQRADELSSGRRVRDGAEGMTVSVDAGDDVEPLPAAVEVAAYRIALEAITNAQRHARARTCTVTLRREGGTLLLRVTDSGTGLAGDHPVGVGLISMRERAAELGGTCTVRSGAGTGTTVEAVLPIADEPGH